MARKKKIERVEMVDSRGNIARPWPEHVDKWLEKGWRVVSPAATEDEGDQE